MAGIKKHSLFLTLFFLILIFSRFYNLDYTARFTQDESSDLARMHAYWGEKKLTLVGPIAVDNSKIFGSLTYYMQMPFAVLYNFEPVGPAIGTAFWGVITVILLMFLSLQQMNIEKNEQNKLKKQRKNNKDSFLLQIKNTLQKIQQITTTDSWLILFWILILIWPPLLLTSRWAWNPHLIPFWISLALVLRQLKFKSKYFFIGLFLGLTIHHHYLSVFAIGAFAICDFVKLLKQKSYSSAILLTVGLISAVFPFVIFDLRHPPGLFFTRYLQSDTPHLADSQSLNLLDNLVRNFLAGLTQVVHLWWLQLLFVIGFVELIWLDLKKDKQHLLYLVPVFVQIVGCIVIDDFPQRYFLPAAVFLLAWLIQSRKNFASKTANYLLILMIISSLVQLPRILSQPILSPPMRVTTQAQHVIIDLLNDNPEIMNCNIAALTARDLDSLGLKYRDLLSIRGITFRAASEYDATEHLFVVSDLDEISVRKDKNVAMSYFKDQELRGEYLLNEDPWRVFWFSY